MTPNHGVGTRAKNTRSRASSFALQKSVFFNDELADDETTRAPVKPKPQPEAMPMPKGKDIATSANKNTSASRSHSHTNLASLCPTPY